jgi:hypothetical protein
MFMNCSFPGDLTDPKGVMPMVLVKIGISPAVPEVMLEAFALVMVYVEPGA